MEMMTAKRGMVIIGVSALAVILGVDALYFGTVTDTVDKSIKDMPAGPPDTIRSEVMAASNGFAIDFYRQVSGGDDNVFFSPLSVYTALSIVGEGAGGRRPVKYRTYSVLSPTRGCATARSAG